MDNKDKLGQEPAFAQPIANDGNGAIYSSAEKSLWEAGMNKRFYAACAAMQGMLANPKQSKHKSNVFVRLIQLFFPKTSLTWCNSDYDELIKESYNVADELLKQEIE